MARIYTSKSGRCYAGGRSPLKRAHFRQKTDCMRTGMNAAPTYRFN